MAEAKTIKKNEQMQMDMTTGSCAKAIIFFAIPLLQYSSFLLFK